MRNDKSEGDDVTLNDKSKVSIALVAWLAGVLIGLVPAAYYLGTSISEIKTKLDALTSMVASVSSKTSIVEDKLASHEREDASKWTGIDARVSVLERGGSEKAQRNEREISELRKDLQVHIDKTAGPTGGTK